MTSTGLFGDVLLPAANLVREARPVQHGHASVRPCLHPGHRSTVGDTQRLRHLPGAGTWSVRNWPRAPGYPARPGCRATHSRHADELPCLAASCATGGPGGRPDSRQDGAQFVVVERDYTALGAKMSALGPLMEKLGTMTKGVSVNRLPRSRRWPGSTGHPGWPGRSSGLVTAATPAKRSSRCRYHQRPGSC